MHDSSGDSDNSLNKHVGTFTFARSKRLPLKTESRILSVVCALILAGILTVGLWPFHAPLNDVHWLTKANGVVLGHHGTILGSGRPASSIRSGGRSGTFEIWLRPSFAEDTGTILAVFRGQRSIPFSLHQSEADLAVQKDSTNAHIPAKGGNVLFVDDVFRNRKLVFITITSGMGGTAVYVDGNLARIAPKFQLSADDFDGQLVFGTSPVVNDSWSGQLHGLAIYQQELTAAQVSRQFQTWMAAGRLDIGYSERPLGLYLFDEHQGRAVRDHGGSRSDLYIPGRYTILHEKFLEPPWSEFHEHWGYWKNVLINIGGFVPLGFFFCAYLTIANRFSRPQLVTIILGAAVSLTIEILQAWLPTRDSGMTDLITNTLGSYIGVMLYRWNPSLVTAGIHHARVAIYR